ncbi:MAG: aminotransferase class V-fold PLP-dependent enzyme [Candidatus Cloacimonadales bacterium]|nr:aminotransferase class V-fold PLP-dependent enzyme [Candidatus Cloacimonadales bacterium]
MIKKSDFLLNQEIIFFNNGSYGACPKTVFNKYQEWQRIIEFQPVEFFQKTLLPELKRSRQAIGDFINCQPNDLILVRNATYATNIVIRSLDLKKGDEVLVTNHEYGACLNAWEFWKKEKGFKLKEIKIELPLPDTTEIIRRIKSCLNPKTKVIFFSHISSKTAQLFPAEEICKLARENNIISIIDGAHSIGQCPLNIKEIDPDFYFSNIHKWLFAPKGTAFLYTRKELQSKVKPLITGWGWGPERELPSGSDYIDSNQFYGTADLSSFLTVEVSINFYKENKIEDLKKNCHELVEYFCREADKITVKKTLYNHFPDCLMMAVIEVPTKYSVIELKELLYEKYRIEVPVIEWEGKLLIRISIQVFNTKDEVDYFLKVLKEIF